MISRLNGWSSKRSSPSAIDVLVADERLVLGHDLPHGGLDPLEVLVAEVGTARQLEVVVEAVLDHRPDGVVGPGPQPEHGLGQDMGRRVPEHGPAPVGLGGQDGDLGAVLERRVEVHLGPVEGGGHCRLGQAGADGLGELEGGGAGVELLGRTIGKSDADGCHGCASLLRVVRRPIRSIRSSRDRPGSPGVYRVTPSRAAPATGERPAAASTSSAARAPGVSRSSSRCDRTSSRPGSAGAAPAVPRSGRGRPGRGPPGLEPGRGTGHVRRPSTPSRLGSGGRGGPAGWPPAPTP